MLKDQKNYGEARSNFKDKDQVAVRTFNSGLKNFH
jgi:hypothetical protein